MITTDRTGQGWTGLEKNVTCRTGWEKTGRDRTGGDRTGHDRKGQDRTGQGWTGLEKNVKYSKQLKWPTDTLI